MDSISVILTNYNYGRFLTEALDSVLSQTVPADEVIVVDDGSTDESYDILDAYAKNYSVIRPVYQVNQGQGSAMNRGFRESKGNVILLMDSDDIWYSEKIEQVLYHIRNCGFVQHNLTFKNRLYRSFLINSDHREYMLRFGMYDFFVPTSGLCFRREVLENVFPLPEDDILRICADAYITRLVLYHSEMTTIKHSLGVYRVHENNNWTGKTQREPDRVPRIIRLINRRLAECGKPEIPLERNWLLYGEDAKNIDASIAVLNELQTRSTQATAATALKGYLFLALKRYENALECFQHVVDDLDFPSHEHGLEREIQSIVYLEQYHSSKSEDFSKNRYGASLNKIYGYLGFCLHIAGDQPNALNAFHKSLHANSQQTGLDAMSPKEIASTYYHMAVCYVRLARYEQALEAFANVLKYDPDRLDIHLNRSDSFRYLGRYEEARAELDVLASKQPNYPGIEETFDKIRRACPPPDFST